MQLGVWQLSEGREKYERSGLKEEERSIRAQWWDVNGTAQAAPNAPTRESGLGPKTAKEGEQKQLPKKKASV